MSGILRCSSPLFVALTRTRFERYLNVNRISRKVNALQTKLCDSTGIYVPTIYITSVAEKKPHPLRWRRPNQRQLYVWTFQIKERRVGVKALFPFSFHLSLFVFVFFSFLLFCFLFFMVYLFFSPFIYVFIFSFSLFLPFTLVFYFLHLEYICFLFFVLLSFIFHFIYFLLSLFFLLLSFILFSSFPSDTALSPVTVIRQ